MATLFSTRPKSFPLRLALSALAVAGLALAGLALAAPPREGLNPRCICTGQDEYSD